MSRSTPIIDLKNGTVDGKKIERTCKNCMRLPVCWLVVSVKNALEGHEKAMNIKMFEWEKLGAVCDQHYDAPFAVLEGDL